MIKTVLFSCLSLIFVFGCTSNSNQSETNEDWQILFNGIDLDDWVVKIHQHEVGDNYANTFRVVDGKIQVNYDEYDKFNNRYGHLFYKKPFSSFHLKFEYRFTDQWMEDAASYTYRNSGVMFHSQDPNSILKDQDWPISVEYQMLAREVDGQARPTGNMCSPGTEVFYEGSLYPDHCINSSSSTFDWNEWVKADLIVYRDSLIIHMVNGDTVLRYSKPHIGGEVANRFDPNINIDGKPLTSGYIGLQAEGQGVEFKEIKLRKLD